MALRKNPNNQEIKNEVVQEQQVKNEPDNIPVQTSGFNYEEEQRKITEALAGMPPSVIDSMENNNAIELEDDDKGPVFPDPEELQNNAIQDQILKDQADNAKGMAVHPPDFYEQQDGFKPAIEVTTRKEGFTAKEEKKMFDKLSGKTIKMESDGARPASDVDLAHLDESMIMFMPEIKAASFKIVDMLDPKPKDPTLRFKWANCKNYVAGNLGKYLAMGFQVADVKDVDEKRTPIDPSMIDGTQVKYYDVVLLKINVIRLMELYKTNIIKSISKLARAREKGLAEANRQFRSDISSVPGASSYLAAKRQALGHEPIEFYQTE